MMVAFESRCVNGAYIIQCVYIHADSDVHSALYSHRVFVADTSTRCSDSDYSARRLPTPALQPG